MSLNGPFPIVASVDRAERAALAAALRLINAALSLVEGERASFAELAFLPGMALPATSGAAAITSLWQELRSPPASPTALLERWSSYLKQLQTSQSAVFVCTIFRHVPQRHLPGNAATLARIRQLNTLALELSRSLGVGVIDIDRSLAHFGARLLQTDFRLGGGRAATAAGHTIAEALLAWGLDEVMDPLLQERARERLGGLERVPQIFGRLESREASPAAAEAE